MPLVNMRDMVDHAYRHSYAVGAFELVNLEFLQGVMAAAERCRAPVILSLAEPHPESLDFDLLVAAVECAAQRASVPVAIHLHHGRDVRSAVRAINAGCNGVMVDASNHELGEDIAITGEVVAMARSCGVPVEGKLGYVPRAEDESARPDRDPPVYTSVAEARGYVDRTGVDFLAVSIGTVRGRTKTKPKLDWQ
ncbi:MAG: class II fructose-bisphosphate aldolase, partial [Gammaproteobacteria bacterium]